MRIVLCVLAVAALAGCAGANAVGTGFGMASGYQPYQPYQNFQLQPMLMTHTPNYVIQRDPIGGIGGPTFRMQSY